MNIYQRINAVMKAVAYVQKDAQVQSYKAVTHDNVTAVLRPELVKQGIVVEVSQVSGSIIDTWTTKNGALFHRYAGKYSVSFVNIETPDDRVTVFVNAHADDNADKAPGKAMSYATKYGMLKTFSLETGENEESRYGEPYSDEQLSVFHELVEQEKAYEFFLFVSTIQPDVYSALYNTFPEGKKSAGKKAASKLYDEGRVLFDIVLEQLKEKIDKQDPAALEITGEMTAVEKKFLVSRLTEFEVSRLSKMKAEAA